MPRPAVLLLALLAACSSTTTPTSTQEPPGTTSSPTTTTTIPATTAPGAELSAPQLPDPFELAEEPLLDLEVDDFDFEEVDSDLLDAAQFRISLFGGLYSASIFDELVSDDGEEVVVFSLYPVGPVRGDPTLARVLADAVAEAGPEFVETEERDLDGRVGHAVVETDATWVLWANNTHVFVTVGDDGAAAMVMKAVIAETAGSEYLWQDGDCLFFEDGVPYAPYGEGNVVDCDDAHLWEVVTSEPLPDATDAAFPDEELGERVGASCEQGFFEFVGVLPIDSNLNLVFYLPDEAEWDEGDRYFACIIGVSDDGGEASLTSGSLEGEGQTVVRTVGDCFRRFFDVGQVDCDSPHVFEYVGVAPYPGAASDDYPGGEELADAFEESCTELIDAYVTELTVEGATVTPFPAGINSFAWEQGRRGVPCFAYAVEDDVALDVVGSFSEGWGPLGEVDGSIQV